MDFNTFNLLSKEYTAILVYRRLMADILTPVSLFMTLRKGAEHPFLLESVEGGEQLARYSFLGRDPFQILRYQQQQLTLQKQGEAPKELSQDYYSALKKLTTEYK